MSDEFDLDQEGIGDDDGIELPEATEAELVAQNAADQVDRGASQTEPEDFLAQEFEYENPDGTKVVLTGEQLLEAQEKATTLEAELAALKAKAEEKPADKPADQPTGEMPTIEPVDFAGVGENFQAMLEGENGGVAAIGPALHDVMVRTIATDPMIADLIGRYIDFRVGQREQGAKVETSFKAFVGEEISDTDIADFQKSNPWAQTKKEALIGIKAIRAHQQVETLKAGKDEALKTGKKQGEKEALIRAKARGTLRPLTGAKGGHAGATGDLTKKYDITDQEQRSQAMAEFIKNRRASGKV